MTRPRVLIACIGNIFLGDDAFGVEVAREFAARGGLPDGVRVVDFGIRGLDLTYALLDECDIAILVDAAPRGHAPGTLYVIEPQCAVQTGEPCGDASPASPLIDAHGMDPLKVLQAVAMMGGRLHRILLVGCEPAPFDSDQDMRMALSPAVQAAVPRAVELIESLITKMTAGEQGTILDSQEQESLTKGNVTHVNPHTILQGNSSCHGTLT